MHLHAAKRPAGTGHTSRLSLNDHALRALDTAAMYFAGAIGRRPTRSLMIRMGAVLLEERLRNAAAEEQAELLGKLMFEAR